MKPLIATLLTTLLLSACQNNAPSSENSYKDNGVHSTATAQNNINQNAITNNAPPTPIQAPKRQHPTPPTANELLNELKLGNVWQSLPFNYDNLSDDWQLLVVSDDDFNDLNLPIVKKDKFGITFEKSTSSDNHWIYMPNNCNSMSGKIQLTHTGIKENEGLLSTEIHCGTLPTELDDHLIHTAILKGNYEILEKDKQRILKIHHNNQYWFFYSYDPMSPSGLLKSFSKDRDDFNGVDFNQNNLLGDWRLYAISDKYHMPTDLPVWQKNADERYLISFKTDTTNQLWISMPNYCNQIKIPFTTKENGIVADFNQIISTNAKCDIPEYYKDANESIIHNAIYNGTYQILQNDNGLLLKINHNDRILFFVSHSYNEKEKAYWEQNGRK